MILLCQLTKQSILEVRVSTGMHLSSESYVWIPFKIDVITEYCKSPFFFADVLTSIPTCTDISKFSGRCPIWTNNNASCTYNVTYNVFLRKDCVEPCGHCGEFIAYLV